MRVEWADCKDRDVGCYSLTLLSDCDWLPYMHSDNDGGLDGRCRYFRRDCSNFADHKEADQEIKAIRDRHFGAVK